MTPRPRGPEFPAPLHRPPVALELTACGSASAATVALPPGAGIRRLEHRRPGPGLQQRLVGRTVGEVWRDATRMPEPGAMLDWTDEDATP